MQIPALYVAGPSEPQDGEKSLFPINVNLIAAGKRDAA